MRNETVEEFVARGGKIKVVGEGSADKIIERLQTKTLSLNSRYHVADLVPVHEVAKFNYRKSK